MHVHISNIVIPYIKFQDRRLLMAPFLLQQNQQIDETI